MTDILRAEVMSRAANEVWAMLPSALMAMLAGALTPNPSPKGEGNTTGEGERQAVTRPGPKAGRIARVPIVGTITRRDSFWSMFFGGGASVERITRALREIRDDDSISTVVLDIDSPGGTVSGLPELASEIHALRDSKQVVALANSLSASAAYWLASQADEIVATPEALTGSIGVFTLHEDWSKYLEAKGIAPTLIHAGKYKVEGNPYGPLSDEARAHIQSMVNDAYALFVGDVAAGRGVSAAEVMSKFGEGRLLTAQEAKKAGLVDRVAGADETLQRLMGRKAETPTPTLPRRDEAATGEGGEDNKSSNSQARIALMRRRLEIAQKL